MNSLIKEVHIECDNEIFNTGYGAVFHLDASNHKVELKYAGEPRMGDFYYDMYIDGRRIGGFVWGWEIAFIFGQKYIVCQWMKKLYERKTIFIDIENQNFVEMDRRWKIKNIKSEEILLTRREDIGDKNSKVMDKRITKWSMKEMFNKNLSEIL